MGVLGRPRALCLRGRSAVSGATSRAGKEVWFIVFIFMHLFYSVRNKTNRLFFDTNRVFFLSLFPHSPT